MEKLAIVLQPKQAGWRSCRSITSNLLNSYGALKNLETKNFFLSSDATPYDMLIFAQELSDWGPSKISFIDHQPCPAGLFKFIHEKFGRQALPQLIIHIFGDFVLHSTDWIQNESFLKYFSIQWVTASSRQKKLMDQFFADSQNQSKVIPFPVDVSDFNFSEALRQEARKHRNLSEGEQVFFYSGRLSFQKNVTQLVQAFHSFSKLSGRKTVLALAGPVDDLGSPYFGKRHPEGLMAYRLQNILKKFNSGNSRIEYWGNLPEENLLAAYLSSDIFVSLSTHNDEDYGMAPAEALMTGLPCLLTKWGGYADFHDLFPDKVLLVKTGLPPRNYLDLGLVSKKLFQIGSMDHEFTRHQSSLLTAQKISGEAITLKLEELVSAHGASRFAGWTDAFSSISYSFETKPLTPFANGEEASNLYKKVYSAYVD